MVPGCERGATAGGAGQGNEHCPSGAATRRPVLRSKMEPNGDKGRGKDKERLGITNADRLQFDRESLERLANYLTKYTNRKRRWRQSRALRSRSSHGRTTEIHTEAAGTAGDERHGVRFGILAAEVSGLGDQRHNAHTKRCDKGMEHIPETSQDGPAKKKRGFAKLRKS